MEDVRKEIEEAKRGVCVRLCEIVDMANASVDRGEMEPREALELMFSVLEVFPILLKREMKEVETRQRKRC